MNTSYLTPEGALDEQAWSEMCAAAGKSAAHGCGSSDGLFRQKFSNSVEGRLQDLPAELRARAIELANKHGDYATPEELSVEQDWNADNGFCSHGIELNCCPAGCGDIEAEMSFDPSASDHFWEMHDDTQRAEGQDLQLVDLPAGPADTLRVELALPPADLASDDNFYADEMVQAWAENKAFFDAQARDLADSVYVGLSTAAAVLRADGLHCELKTLPFGVFEAHRVQLSLSPVGAPQHIPPYVVEIVTELVGEVSVKSALALLDKHGQPFALSAFPENGFAWAADLVAAVRQAADLEVAQLLPRNPLVRWIRGLAEQALNVVRPTARAD